MDQQTYHIPALLLPTVDALEMEGNGIYVDATYGGGGHSAEILSRITSGHLYAFDQDIQALERATSDPRVTLIHGNFRYLRNYLRFYGVKPGEVDGIIADLGVSFHHFDDASRGFSFRFDGDLDMRMNTQSRVSAASLIADSSEEELADIIYLYGELKNARRIASAIVKARNSEPITTVGRFLEVVKPFINPKQEKKELAQLFQALRIAVNDELSALKALLEQSLQMLRPGGHLAIITYHSLEDRLVKNFMKTGNFQGKPQKDFFGKSTSQMKLITSKPIVPSDREVEANPRSRSAKLRVAVKLDNE